MAVERRNVAFFDLALTVMDYAYTLLFQIIPAQFAALFSASPIAAAVALGLLVLFLV